MHAYVCVLQVNVHLQLDLEQCLTDHIANVTVTRQVTVKCTFLKFQCLQFAVSIATAARRL
jgi:hypothetical protein